jgi:hypothetical protein
MLPWSNSQAAIKRLEPELECSRADVLRCVPFRTDRHVHTGDRLCEVQRIDSFLCANHLVQRGPGHEQIFLPKPYPVSCANAFKSRLVSTQSILDLQVAAWDMSGNRRLTRTGVRSVVRRQRKGM